MVNIKRNACPDIFSTAFHIKLFNAANFKFLIIIYNHHLQVINNIKALIIQKYNQYLV